MATKEQLLAVLAEFGEHPNMFIANTATMIDNAIFEFERGQLRRDELDELIDDALDSARIYKLTENSNTRTTVIQALQTIKGIVSDLLMFL